MSQHKVVTISLYVEEFMDFESLVSHAYGSRLPYYRGRGGGVLVIPLTKHTKNVGRLQPFAKNGNIT